MKHIYEMRYQLDTMIWRLLNYYVMKCFKTLTKVTFTNKISHESMYNEIVIKFHVFCINYK